MTKNYTVEETKQLILNQMVAGMKESSATHLKILAETICILTQSELMASQCDDCDEFPEDIHG